LTIFSAMAQRKILRSPGLTAPCVFCYRASNLSTLVRQERKINLTFHEKGKSIDNRDTKTNTVRQSNTQERQGRGRFSVVLSFEFLSISQNI